MLTGRALTPAVTVNPTPTISGTHGPVIAGGQIETKGSVILEYRSDKNENLVELTV